MKAFYGYFDPTEEDSREYVADELAELSRARGGTGVGDGLSGSPAGGLTVSVSPGHAMIDGYVYSLIDDNSGPEEITLSVAGSAERIDRLVLRLDLSANARSIRLLVLEGVPAASPVPPDITRSELVKEISLCQIRVRAAAWDIREEDITDERLDAEVCGALISEQLAKALADKLTLLAAAIAKKASTETYFATLAADGWSTDAPYVQTVAVEGILLSDDPFVDIDMSGAETGEEGTALSNAWTLVGRVTAGAGTLTAYCYEDVPEVDLPILLKVVR